METMASEERQTSTLVKNDLNQKNETEATDNETSHSTQLKSEEQLATDDDRGDGPKEYSSLSSSVTADNETADPDLIDLNQDMLRKEHDVQEDGNEINGTPTKSETSSKYLNHSESLVISEIDSQYSPSMNDSRCSIDLLSSIQSATQEIREKRDKLKEEGIVLDKKILQGLYLEQAFSSASSATNNSNGEHVTTATNNNTLEPSHPPAQSPFADLNTPIMMVPGQHLLLPRQLKQLQQVQHISMNYAHPAHGADSSSSLSSQIYAATATTSSSAATTHIHNGNHAVVLQTLQPGQSILHHAVVGRRTMKLKLMEEVRTDGLLQNEGSKKSIFSRVSVLARRTRSMGSSDDLEVREQSEMEVNSGSPQKMKTTAVDRGEVTISWYDGTSTVELHDHVRKSVETKMRIGRKKLLLNLRVIDESTDPPEEIVLSPFIPDGSSFLVKFYVKDLSRKWQSHIQHHRAPPSPSAAPSPPGELEQELQRQISDVLNAENSHRRYASSPPRLDISSKYHTNGPTNAGKVMSNDGDKGVNTDDDGSRQNEINDILAQRLEKLNDTLLLLHDEGTWAKDDPNILKTEKKQVIFVIANYFVLFLSLIAISAEIHERAPRWMAWIDTNITTVQNCASDKDALFQCVSEGNFSGLIASVVLWASQSVATKRFFLFGFDSPKKLWRVVYECCVTSFCWGFSYIFIRRGLNPDTRGDCVRKYWKDAVYGSLAGFNAAFMKAVLKNLLPQADEILVVMEHRQVRLFHFLGKIFQSIPGGQPHAHVV